MSKTPKSLVAVTAAVLFLHGCQGNSTTDAATPAATPTSNVYSGQSLPAQVDRLGGTPLYTKSAQMAGAAKLPGAPFLLMAPQNPTEALLVVEVGSAPTDLVNRPSELGEFSGVTEMLDAPDLVKFVKDETALDLKQEGGKVVMLKVEKGSGTATPGAQP